MQQNDFYIRTRQLSNVSNDTLVLESRIQRFVPTRGNSSPILSLVGVVHIGEASYYKQIQSFLDTQNIVLYERVKPPKKLPTPTPTPEPIASPTQTAPPPRPPASIQKRLADTLGLTFQLTEIHYDRPFFINSDLSVDDLRTIASKSGKGTEDQLNGLLGMLTGQGFMGAFMNGMMDRMDKNPRQRAYFKRFLMQTLSTQGMMETALGGAPAGQMSLGDLIIVERNKAVISDVKSTIATKKPRTLSVFYGAGHMEDMQKRLITELGYKPTETRWIPAITDKKEPS